MYIEQIFGKKNITHKDIENLFKNVKSEHRNLELKETVTREKLLETVTGMANARGGLLIIGVSDKREIKGIQDKNIDSEKINNWIQDIEPSLTDHYDIITLSFKKDKTLYLIDIEPSGNKLCGFKADKKFVYYIRKGLNTKQITPNEIIIIATQKENYEYNENYRKNIIYCIDNATNEIARFLEIKNAYLIQLAENENKEKLIDIILNTKTKNLSINIYQEILQLNSNILNSEENEPHKNLTIDEDKSKIELLNRISDAYGYDRRLNENQIKKMDNLVRYWLHNKPNKYVDYYVAYPPLSLAGYIRDACIYEIMYNFLKQFLFSYEYSLKYILDNFDIIYKSKKLFINKEVKDNLKEMFEKFPSEMARELIIVIKIMTILKNETKKILYLDY